MDTELDSNVFKEPASPTPYFGLSTQKRNKIIPPKIRLRIDKKLKEETSLLNKQPLSRNAVTYELEKFKKKLLIIFNNKHFFDHSVRNGTEKDAEELKYTFSCFDFEIHEYKDYRKHQIFEVLKTFLEKDFSEYGCLVVAILTHGASNGLLQAKDESFRETDILKYFSADLNNSLATKPKILIIEACRGQNIDTGMPVYMSESVPVNTSSDTQPYFLPVESDTLIIHSSYAGNVSYRDEIRGTWFIQTLCSKIKLHSHNLDLEAIITLVKKDVAINRQHEELDIRTGKNYITKQMPVVTSTLIRKLYLCKYGASLGQSTLEADQRINADTEKQIIKARNLNTTSYGVLNSQDKSCSCYLNHFNYMKMCLKDFVKECPADPVGQTMLDIADSFMDGPEFNTSKEKMTKAIANHLKQNAKNCHFYKYIFMNNL